MGALRFAHPTISTCFYQEVGWVKRSAPINQFFPIHKESLFLLKGRMGEAQRAHQAILIPTLILKKCPYI